MFKKVISMMALSMLLLFGGLFNEQAHADEYINHKQIKPRIEWVFSVNEQLQSASWEQVNGILNELLKNWYQLAWNHPKENNEVEQEPERPEVEQSIPENETDQPDQPVIEAPQKEQEDKGEQPETNLPTIPETPTEDLKTEEQGTNEALHQFEQAVVNLTNEERAKNGLQPLQIDYELSRVARDKSLDLYTNQYFDHNSPVYGSPFDMMRAYGISYRTAGENIAKGQRTPEEVVNAWMNSPGHRANILNGNFTHIGVGYIENGHHWTQMFIGK